MPITKPPVATPWADAGFKVTPSSGAASAGLVSTSKIGYGLFNWLLNFCANGVRYFSRHGIADWDVIESYVAGDLTRDTDGAIYELAGTATVGTAPHLDRKNWSRWLIRDRWGYDVDRRVALRQDFVSDESVSRSTTGISNLSTLSPGTWSVATSSITSGSAVAACGMVRSVSRLQPLLTLTTPGGAGDNAWFFLRPSSGEFSADNVISMALDFAIDNVSSGQDVVVGIGKGDPFAVSDWYAAFVRLNTDTNWHLQSSDGTVTGSPVDSGVAPASGVLQRLVVEWVGANRSPTGSAQCRFSINGVLVGTLTGNLPGSATNPDRRPFVKITNAGGTSLPSYIGDLRFTANIKPADAF